VCRVDACALEPVRFVDRLVDPRPGARSKREQAPSQRGGRSLAERLEFQADRGGRYIECIRCGTGTSKKGPEDIGDWGTADGQDSEQHVVGTETTVAPTSCLFGL
jgi:hypothetical protein